MLLTITIDIISAIFIMVTIIMALMVIFRTENGLDRVYKYYLAGVVAIFISAIMILNRYFDLVSFRYTEAIYQTSRLLAFAFFMLGTQVMLLIIKKENKE